MKNRQTRLYSSLSFIPLFLSFFQAAWTYQSVLLTVFLASLLGMGIILYILFNRIEKLTAIVNSYMEKANRKEMVIETVDLDSGLSNKELLVKVINSEALLLKELQQKINISDIFYLKAEGSGVKIIGKKKQVWLWKKMKDCEAVLPSEFIKVHRSYIVNLNYLRELKDGNMRLKCGKLISVGNTRKEEVRSKIEAFLSKKV